MSTTDEQRFSASLYELPSNYAHIMNVAMDVPPEVSLAFGLRGTMDPWMALRPSRRKECLVVLADAKTPGTRSKRIARIVQAAIDEGTPRV